MIFWDLSLHVLSLLGLEKKVIGHSSIFSYYYPNFRWRRTSDGLVERPEQEWKPIYQKFWVSYWGLAFILLIFYLSFH